MSKPVSDRHEGGESRNRHGSEQAVAIPLKEYEERRHAFDLCRWINSRLGILESCDNFDELYFERRAGPDNIKKLLEEAIPLSRLGLHLSTPANDVYVTCLAGNQPYDAEIEIRGFASKTFKVEVTTTETKESTLRRQALSRYGFVALSGPIERSGREIISSGEMVEIFGEEQRWIDLMFERLRTKDQSGRYGKDTAILVYLTAYRRIGLESRATLVRRTQQYLREPSSCVEVVYYCYITENCVDEVRA